MSRSIDPKIGEPLICSVCGKSFEASADTKYICNGGYTCSWKCFLQYVKEHPVHHKEEKAKKPKEKIIFKWKSDTTNMSESPSISSATPSKEITAEKEELW